MDPTLKRLLLALFDAWAGLRPARNCDGACVWCQAGPATRRRHETARALWEYLETH